MHDNNNINAINDSLGDDDPDFAELIYLTAVHVEIDLEFGTVTGVFVDDDSAVLLDRPETLDLRDRVAFAIAERESWPPWHIGL